MTAKTRLRVVPTIAFEPEEGLRLRRSAGEAGLQKKAKGAEKGRPRHPWRSEVYDVQMMAKIAVTLIDDLFQNVKAMEEIHEIHLRDHLGIDEISFQIHTLKRAAEALQPN